MPIMIHQSSSSHLTVSSLKWHILGVILFPLIFYEDTISGWLHVELIDINHLIMQANHRMTTNVQRRLYGHATDVEIRPLNEQKAVQAAVDLIGELFVFSVG